MELKRGFVAFWDEFTYVSARERRLKAERELRRRIQAGLKPEPVVLGHQGFRIATTFWGQAWCDNLERYSDFANRLPRGRTYVRNSCVIHLEISPRLITAVVSGSELYEVKIEIGALSKSRWADVCSDCSGAIDSVVELLQGKLSNAVMSRLCQKEKGLFPKPSEMKFACSCPDRASMCKHVAAVLYGVGARLDHQPELLFVLRAVDHEELTAQAGKDLSQRKTMPSSSRMLKTGNLSAIFGIEIADAAIPSRSPRKTRSKPKGKA
jgi:uncharacterized Zn finger protein